MTQGQNPQNPYQPPYAQPSQSQQPAQPPYAQPSQSQQPAQQPPYGYAQPAAPAAGNAPSGYGQGSQPSSAWGQQSGYPTPQQAYQQGGPAMPYGQQPQQRSPLLGMVALGGVVVCTVVLSWFMWRIGSLFGPIAVATGGSLTAEELTDALTSQLGSNGMLALNIAGYGGMAFWVTGIVATATRRGRGYGVWAIILGVLAPIIAAIILVAAIMPYLTP